jgi:hypothetical protein
MNNVLFINHSQQQCGVYQFGKRVADIIQRSNKYNIVYTEIQNITEFNSIISKNQYKVVIYNWYPSTMTWASPSHVAKHKNNFVQVGIFHEVPSDHFDYYIHADPTQESTTKTFITGRPLLNYSGVYPEINIPTIGSFGFGMGGKGYQTVVELVESEYDEAIIKLHIPYAYFGDITGEGAHYWVNLAQQKITKPNIQLQVSHDFLSTENLLEWLANNTINIFLYDEMYGRGIGSTLDYALSVKRPIALTKSYMFRHVFDTEPSIFVEDITLKEIISNGILPLEKYYKDWTADNLIRRYDDILEQIITG